MVAVSEDAVAAAPPAFTWLHRYLLVLRVALLNIVAFGLLIAVLLQGWLDGVSDRHTGWLCAVIFIVFLFGLGVCFARSLRVSRELNDLRAGAVQPGSRAAKYLSSINGRGPESRSLSANMLRMRMANYISLVRHTANSLVFLGLVGTVIGFIIALFLLGAIREVLGYGTFLEVPIFGDSYEPWIVFILPPGGFFTIGFILLTLNWWEKRKLERRGAGEPTAEERAA